MKTAEIRRRFLAHFEARGTRRAQRQPGLRRPDPAVRQRGHGAVQAVLPRRAAAAVPARHERAEVRAHPRHRGGRQDHPARVVLPDVRQLSLRRLLQGRRHPVRVGAADPEEKAASASTRSALGDRLPRRRRGVRALARQIGLPDDRIQRRGKEDNYWSMGVPGPCGPCSRSTSTAAPSTAPTAARSPTRSATSRSGTSSSCSTSVGAGPGKDDFDIGELPAKNIDTGMGLERMATILQGVDNIYEIDISWPVLDRAAELTGRTTAATTATTSRCGSSPTTCAPPRC